MFARETHFVNGFLNQYGPDFYKSLKDTNLPLRTPRKKNGKIPRPPNSFILFRQYVSEYAKRRGLTFEYENEQIVLKSSQAYLGKVSSCLWVNLPIDTRLIFKQMSETVKYFHELNYPEYRYSPNRQAHIFKAGRKFKKSKPVKVVSEETIPQTNILNQQNFNHLNQPMTPINDQYLGADYSILTEYTFTATLPSQSLHPYYYNMYNNFFINEFEF
ncbi:hypothetical protein RhiirA5_402010 [Rhizophagus irregularis]|uniref:HMG box domain-containing protein n=3 Tax=Rhizophagus irregularis TaxID=588596 RepID=A0A2N1NKU9_9GLOM|nr:hypothetical protein GLOIN_2v1805285 [Rhizophagus irregularis DAOM 181602=DAOM 197198]EXX59836.1 Rox1p [Rhizophagus irregularis DAOM 197198w]PKC03267.1 hypothetical protein RhiirA5_402010 [Rhizophagus irregularis]PKC61515.1 hypothetical protein RhiirA1_539112 [Rhizophagus irregularis]PKK74506.1 hypothetical protein RhiirC2_820890 [Rhizophagus irregularis]POG65102.1 hypothetical protein GLOIN_2v1805285 [Rhizophagus irregularis DAOM 181602=DAOM 197198]|eukprot:XP_025171968.1 hypothetical protein GLOIN_2v1805285 [Rhizophagus irregularis DAOM 181602=DAOM 197198]